MKHILFVISIALVLTSCKKEEIKTTPLASINITNAIVGGTTAKLGSNVTAISNNNFAQYALIAGTNNLYIYPSGDSLHPYYTQDKFSNNGGEIYSLFLSGIPTAVDAILVKEIIQNRTDSTAGIRFINLSPNSTPLNIALSTTPAVNEVTGLAYKSYTDFKTYSAKLADAYTFQVRKADGTLLTTFSFAAGAVPRFANVTLVIRGQMTGTPAIGVTRVNNDR